MSKMVEATCKTEVFDSVTGKHYYPGDQDTIDLDTDLALSFNLAPQDRKYARECAVARSQARQEEWTEMKKEGFSSIIELREYKKALSEDEEVAEQIKEGGTAFVCPSCSMGFKTSFGLEQHHERMHGKKVSAKG